MARWFRVRGDQLGNQSHGFGWPYGPVALVTPFSFSFPVKIPAVQLMGALYMGIKLVLRVDKNRKIRQERTDRTRVECFQQYNRQINKPSISLSTLFRITSNPSTLFSSSSYFSI
ncbi:putative L-glutamate gamma-semialdehyde dehydrogenase [Helianthus annuus]|nr:putative L-glutamate gamma-semialdehyde dehydrogenase [Helianthus annuus]